MNPAREKGYHEMTEAIKLALSSNQTPSDLKKDLLAYGVVIAELKIQIKQLKEDNIRYRGVLLAIQANNINSLKEELLGAYQALKDKISETDKMLMLIKESGGTIGLDYIIEYNQTIGNGIDTLTQLVIKTNDYEDFEICSFI